MQLITLVNGNNNNITDPWGCSIGGPTIINGPTANYVITGLLAPGINGVEIELILIDGYQCTISHLSSSSSVSNRLICSTAADIILSPPPSGGFRVIKLHYCLEANPFLSSPSGSWLVIFTT